MATVAVVATAQPANSPPRVKVDVTDSGTPAINSVTVVRKDASGVTTPVRTSDGGPLQLVTSGSTRVGTVYDYEAPYGLPFTYSTVEYPTGVSASVTLAVAVPWLVHPGVPSRSIPVSFRINSFDTQTRAVATGVFSPMLRANPIVITDGRRHGRTSSFIVGTETLADLTALHTLIDDAGVLQLNVPPSLALGVDTCYIAVMDVQEKRRTNIGADPYRDVEMPYVVVDRPVGGSQAIYTWAGVIAKYATWQALIDANATWAAVQIP